VPNLGPEVHVHMRLTWRDAVSTVLVLVGLSMALSVVQGWGWPFLGGVRAGIIALGVTGVAACMLGSPGDRFFFTDPFGLITTLIAVTAIAIAIVGGLITGMQQFLFVLMGVIVVLWVVATLRHAVEGTSSAPVKRVFG
jgi:hypothetical protein